jgi:hypothetical protein
MGSPRPVLARGKVYMPRLMVHCNINVAMQYHEFVISRFHTQSARWMDWTRN